MEKGRELGRRGEPSAEGMVCAADTRGSKNWAKFEEVESKMERRLTQQQSGGACIFG